MSVIDWREVAVNSDILREPGADASRLIVWAPAGTEGDFQHWERIGTAARGEVLIDNGLCTTPVATIRARRRVKGLFGRLVDRLGAGKGKRSLILPNGDTAEQHGERSGDGLLVWPADPSSGLDEATLRSRWPDARRLRGLGPRLFLVEGAAASRSAPANGPASTAAIPPSADGNPRLQAEAVLVAARQSGNRAAEATALADLGIIALGEGKARDAIGLLEQALNLARPLGDPARENDILGNLGMALLHVQQPAKARQLFEQEVTYARSIGDPLAEKLAVERIGLAASFMGDPRGALNWFERGLAITRRVGDQHQEANLLWLQAIQLAELDDRDAAIARGQEAIALFGKLGKPQASWYGAYLQKYRMGLFDTWPSPAPAGGAPGPESYLGGALVAGVMAAPAQVQAQAQANPNGTSGPGLLRMALSATRSMAQFAGSGFKTTPPDLQRRRIETCASCEHHTGVRCKICGCFTAAKSRLAHESCPIGKWPG